MQTVVFSKIESAFHAALAARESGAPVDLHAICESDPALVAEVQTLLRHYDEASFGAVREDGSTVGFLDPEALHRDRSRAMLEEWGTTAVGQRVGDFTLIEQIGSGAMGVVFLAEQENPRRIVALKLIRRSVATPAMIKRFEREAQLLGRLNHSGIAQVYHAGVAEIAVDSGDRVQAPYIAMEYVDGPTIMRFVRDNRADPELVLKLIGQVCDAVQHAHQRGIIHRDLKPANILVCTDQAGQPHVKVLDFGVARQADAYSEDRSNETHLTLQGHFIGTPAYMSPQQMRSSEDLDVRSDVYALGAILYQLLADRLPIKTTDCSLAEAARHIAEDQPTRLGSLRREFRGDIETIVAKTLEKDPQRRYQSAAELCRDIRHHLAGEMIEVRRDSLVYLMAKKAARYRNMFIAAALLLAVGIAFALFARHQQQNELQAKREAQSARRRADDTSMQLAAELSATRIDEGRLLGQNSDIPGAEKLLWDEWFEHPSSLAVNWALRELYWRSQCIRTFRADSTECRTIAVSPDDRSFTTGGGETSIRTWAYPGAEKISQWETGLTSVRASCYLPTGRRVAVAGEGGARIIDLATGARLTLGDQMPTSYAVDCASTGLAVAVGGEDGVIRLFDPDGGKLIASVQSDPSPLRAVRFDNSCYHLAAIHANGAVKLWQLRLEPNDASATPLAPIEGHPGWIGTALAFSPDGSLLVSGASDRIVKLWSVPDGTMVHQFVTNNGPVRSVGFSADGQRIVVPGFWRTQIFNVDKRTMTALGDAGGFDAKYIGDGVIVVAGTDGTCRIWEFDHGATVIRSTSSQVREMCATRAGDESILATLQLDGTLRLLKRKNQDSRDAEWRSTPLPNVGDKARALAMTADGKWIVAGRADGHILTVRVSDGQIVQDWLAHDKLVDVLRLSPDGQSLVSGGSDGALLFCKRKSDQNGWELDSSRMLAGEIDGLAISPDSNPNGANLVTTSKAFSLDLWSYATGKLLREITLPATGWRLAMNSDGTRLAVGTWDRTIQIWNISSMHTDPAAVRQEMNLVGHTQLVTGEAFDSTGTLMASISTDGTVRLWDVSGTDRGQTDQLIDDRRRCLATFDAHVDDVYAVAFLPSAVGRDLLAAGYIDGTVRIWDLAAFDSGLAGHMDYQKQLRHLNTAEH